MFAILLVLLSLPVLLRAQDIPIPPPPTQWVTDTAGFLSTEDAGRINARLRAYEEQTHHQLIVWIGPTTGDDSIEDWGNRAFEQWKVGRKGIDDGLVLFIMPKDRRLRIEVGYGLEDKVPDLLANRIIQETIVPRIRAGDNAGAVEAGIEAIANAIGEPFPDARPAPPQAEEPYEGTPLTLGKLIFYGLVVLIILGVLGTNPSFATWILLSLLSGGNRRGRRGPWGGGGFGGGSWGGGGGGWGGGGGFSGGGGMSGGGGASGSW